MKETLQRAQYGNVVATNLAFEEGVERVKACLKEEGFGVLCEIDVSKAFKEKLGQEFRPYRILGACNPALAHKALRSDPQLGLLLPCNVVVQEQEGRAVVSAIDALAMLSIAKNPELEAVAQDANARLTRVLERLAS